MVSKEIDSVIGPGLAVSAAEKGIVVTPVDGDQPSLLIGLITWAETLGLEVLFAGKSSEYDFVFDVDRQEITCNGQVGATPGMSEFWTLGDECTAEIAAQRSRVASAFPQRAVPDLCEMAVVANATGMSFDRPNFHAPLTRIQEVPTFFNLLGNGGLMSTPGRLDVFNCLRASTDVSFAGGVFVIVRCDDETTWEMLRRKGHILSRDGSAAMIYIPRHLLGLEAATSILDAVLLGQSSGAFVPGHHVDLVARAERDLAAGTFLNMGGHHHVIDGLAAEVLDAAPLTDEAPAPYYLAANKVLRQSVAQGTVVLMRDLDFDDGSELLALRRKQDEHFFSPRL